MRNVIAFLLSLLSLTLGPHSAQAQQTVRLGPGTGGFVLPAFPLPYSTQALTLNPALRIFNYTENAKPGETVMVQGVFSQTASLALAVGDGAEFMYPLLLSRQPNLLLAELPRNLPVGTHRLFVVEGTGRSEPVLIHQARGDGFDTYDVAVRSPLTLMGANLLVPGAQPTLRLVPKAGGTSLYATYVASGSHAYRLNWIAPEGMSVGTIYQAYVSNGTGGTIGESVVDSELKCLAPSPDLYGLGVGWANNFTKAGDTYAAKTDGRLTGTRVVGDSTTNDATALQANLDQIAAAGGGTYVLPEGRFRYALNAARFYGLVAKSNTVIQGAGRGKTRLLFSSGSAIEKVLYAVDSTKNFGLMDLTIIVTDTASSSFGGLLAAKCKNLFFKNVDFQMAHGNWNEIRQSQQIAVIDCHFTQRATGAPIVHGPLATDESEFVTLRGNTMRFVAGGIHVEKTTRALITGNTLIRDMRFPKRAGTVLHLAVADGNTRSLWEANSFKVDNGKIPNSDYFNDGEAIIAENWGGGQLDHEAGKVTGATTNTLSDNTKAWPTTFEYKPQVVIVRGKGFGQRRTILTRNPTTLTLVTPWSVIPDTSSRYSIVNLNLDRVTFYRNNFENTHRGITLYWSPTDKVAIVGNYLRNSGSIDLTPSQGMRSDQESGTQMQNCTPMWGVDILNNIVDGSTDTRNGVSIGPHVIQHVQTTSLGTSVLGLRMIGNTIVAKGPPNLDVIQDELFPSGFHNHTVFHNGGSVFANPNVPTLLGSIIEDNTAINCGVGLYLNSGSYFTIARRNKFLNTTLPLQDATLGSAGHASIGTTKDN